MPAVVLIVLLPLHSLQTLFVYAEGDMVRSGQGLEGACDMVVSLLRLCWSWEARMGGRVNLLGL